MIEISCFYTLSSPWAYLAGPRLQDIVRRHRARLLLKPFDFQDVVPRTGGVPIRTRPRPRRDYHAVELDRWRRYLGMPLNLTPRFYPMENPVPGWNKPAGHMVIAARQAGADPFPLSHALLRALWAEERDIADAAVRGAIADENGYDGPAFSRRRRRSRSSGSIATTAPRPKGSASSGRRPSSSTASCSGDRTGSISSIGRLTGCAGQRAKA